jgi:hypothetical protein
MRGTPVSPLGSGNAVAPYLVDALDVGVKGVLENGPLTLG